VRLALGVALIALLVRLLALIELRGSVWDEVLLGDARFFEAWGKRIAAGDWLGREVFYQAPLYPYLLGLAEVVLGPGRLAVQLLQIVCAAAAAGLLTFSVARALSPRAGWVAGGLLGLHGPAVWYDLQLEKTSLAVSLTAVLAAFLLAKECSVRRALGAGAALGALTLLRENAFVLVVPLGLVCAAERAGRARRTGALAAGIALFLAPVALRNYALGGAPLPTASNAGVNFYIGNGLDADGMYRPLSAGRGHPDFEREDATRIASELSGRALAPAEVSGFWFRLAWREIGADPGHFLGLLVRKARLLCFPGEIMDAVAFEVFQDESLVLRVLAWLGFGLLLPFAVAGLVASAGARIPARLGLAASLLALSIVLFFVVGRFRLGLVPLLAPLAALTSSVGRATPRRAAALAAFIACAALCAWSPELLGNPRAASFANLASELVRRRDFERAEAAAARARELDPASSEAAYNHGVALRGLGRERDALAPFEEAARLEPAYAADCLAEIGAILARTGDEAGARVKLDEALRLDPAHAAAMRTRAALDER
jgi:tetratricopeptide (TPR) repeat protein